MDANGTKYHSLIGKPDWTSYNTHLRNRVMWDEQESGIRLCSRLFHLDKDQLLHHLEPFHRRGAATDRYGNIFWIDNNKQDILLLSREGGAPQRYWSLEDWFKETICDETSSEFRPAVHHEFHKPSYLQGLTISQHDYLIVGIVDPAGLLIFDLHAGNPPHLMIWPHELSFTPFDMAPSSNGGLWILDKGERPRIWRLDEYFVVLNLGREDMDLGCNESSTFNTNGKSGEFPKNNCFQAAIEANMSTPLKEIEPISIETLPDDTIMVLGVSTDKGFPIIHLYEKSELLESYPLNDYFRHHRDVPDLPAHYQLLPHDFILMPENDTTADEYTGRLFISAADRKQTFVFDLKRTLEGLILVLLDCYYPMRTHQGKALVSAGGNVFYDAEEKWVPLIAQRSHYWDEGQVTTRVFDSKLHDCVWHRIFLDAIIPDSTGLRLQCLATNDEESMQSDTYFESRPWIEQPQPYLRSIGSDIPYYNPYSNNNSDRNKAGTWETLLHGVKGRYLAIRMELKGTGRNTPLIHSLRVYYPRFSYLKEYLPAVYQDDEISADFLERFLANVEGLFTTIEDRIACAQVLFDVDSVPQEFLDWLTGWFELIQQETWGEGRRRLWLAHVMELFSQRGTVPGIIRAIRVATDPCPDESIFTQDVTAYYNPVTAEEDVTVSGFHVRIVEDFLLRQAPGVAFGDPTNIEGPDLYTQKNKWEPSHGIKVLNEHYQEYLDRKYLNSIESLNGQWDTLYNSFKEIKLPPMKPEQEIIAEDWAFFVLNELQFTYIPVSRNEADTISYQKYLARRYRTINQLNIAWSLSITGKYKAFDTIQLPQTMPTNKTQLSDWIQFVSLVLPTIRYAHHFTVLVPTALNSYAPWDGPDPEIVRRIVDLEKPAHTRFDVKQYFAMFRVGETRLGMESIIDHGRPLQEMVLGDNYLAEGFLSVPSAWKAPGRFILGRETSGIN